MPVLGWAALVLAGGYAIDKTGEGVNDASSAVLKLAAGVAVIYFIGKKAKVI